MLRRTLLGKVGLAPHYHMLIVHPDRKQLEAIAGLVAEGKLRPIIDRILPLDQAAEAHEYMETGHARGKVVLKVRD